MNDAATLILDAFSSYGLIGVWFVVAFEAFEFVASVPVGPVIVFLGSLASQDILSVYLLWLTVYSAVVVGDNFGFWVGRRFGRPVLYKFGTKIIRLRTIEKADRFFLKFGTVAIFFTRFIFATIAAPLNVIAGASDLPWRKYIIAEMAGQIVWTSLYVFLGYFFGQAVIEYIFLIDRADVVAISLIGLVALFIFGFLAIRALRQHYRVFKNFGKK
jgi:membrane protein DedA with SNARE-associated domain